jgi:hypothetical protein
MSQIAAIARIAARQKFRCFCSNFHELSVTTHRCCNGSNSASQQFSEKQKIKAIHHEGHKGHRGKAAICDF